MSEPTPEFRPDAAKLAYSAKLMYASGVIFALAGAILLISGGNTAMGVLFLALAVAMAMIGRAVSARI